jgi:hypothetical protein
LAILINERSLKGQFDDEDSFIESIKPLLQIIKLIKQFELVLLKNHTFFKSKVTLHSDFLQIVNSSNQRIRQDSSIRLIKSYLLDKPYWNDTQIHNCNTDSYTFNANDICNTSLAESYERYQVVLSFKHDDFLDTLLDVSKKNHSTLKIKNLLNKNLFLDYCLGMDVINIFDYCKEKFKDSNLNFELLEDKFGFNILDANQENEFMNSFNMFSKMTWDNITNSDGLEYKKYKKPKKMKIKGWFRKGKYLNTDIYKFRTTQGYRCFGYRDGNTFYILRFEIDHTISDNG